MSKLAGDITTKRLYNNVDSQSRHYARNGDKCSSKNCHCVDWSRNAVNDAPTFDVRFYTQPILSFPSCLRSRTWLAHHQYTVPTESPSSFPVDGSLSHYPGSCTSANRRARDTTGGNLVDWRLPGPEKLWCMQIHVDPSSRELGVQFDRGVAAQLSFGLY